MFSFAIAFCCGWWFWRENENGRDSRQWLCTYMQILHHLILFNLMLFLSYTAWYYRVVHHCSGSFCTPHYTQCVNCSHDRCSTSLPAYWKLKHLFRFSTGDSCYTYKRVPDISRSYEMVVPHRALNYEIIFCLSCL